MSHLDGLWNSRKDHCGFGYTATWKIETTDGGNNMVVAEQPGSKCCGFVPNCFLKTHRLTKERQQSLPEGEAEREAIKEEAWIGRLGFQTVSVTVVDENTLRHQTTDGVCTLTRANS